jgi:hypothetical protein
VQRLDERRDGCVVAADAGVGGIEGFIYVLEIDLHLLAARTDVVADDLCCVSTGMLDAFWWFLCGHLRLKRSHQILAWNAALGLTIKPTRGAMLYCALARAKVHG